MPIAGESVWNGNSPWMCFNTGKKTENILPSEKVETQKITTTNCSTWHICIRFLAQVRVCFFEYSLQLVVPVLSQSACDKVRCVAECKDIPTWSKTVAETKVRKLCFGNHTFLGRYTKLFDNKGVLCKSWHGNYQYSLCLGNCRSMLCFWNYAVLWRPW